MFFFNIKNKTVPLLIWIEDKNPTSIEENLSIKNNIVDENQNSNQNLFTYNVNNIGHLNVAKNKIYKKIKNSGIKLNEFISAKNFCEYNEYFLNKEKKEIFESKLNFKNRQKLYLNCNHLHFDTIKELNGNEFQQNILVKHYTCKFCTIILTINLPIKLIMQVK